MTTLRKNLLWMSSAEIAKFVRGIKLLKTRGDYDDLIRTHYAQANEAHRTPLFLPWHRAMLLDFERRMQEVLGDPTFGVPYWDWAADASYPSHRGPLWAPGILGGAGSPITDGPFAPPGWSTIDPTSGGDPRYRGRLFRVLANNSGLTVSYPTRDTVTALLTTKFADYDNFRREIEGTLHNNMHVWVGGQMGSVPLSPNDPVFWLHHCNVDRIWYEYQELNKWPGVPSFQYTDVNTGGYEDFNATVVMPPTLNSSGAVTIGSVWDARGKYDYDAFYWITMPFSSGAIGFKANRRAPSIVEFRGMLHAFYQDPDGTGIMHIVSSNGGTAWTKASPFYIGQTTSDGPSAVVFNDTLYLFYRDGGGNGVLWGQSSDGVSWQYNGHVPNTKCDAPPVAAVLNNTLCVLYIDHDGYGIMYAVWDGNTWQQGFTTFTTGDSSDKLPPSIVRFQGKFHALFKDRNGSGIMHIVSTDGKTWTGAATFYIGQTTSGSPCALLFDDELHVFYRDSASKADGILHGHSFDGETWLYDGYIGQTCSVTGGPLATMVGHKSICLLSTGDDGSIHRSIYTWS